MRRPPRSCDRTRRQFLRRAGGAAAASSLVATAGCLGGVRDELAAPPTAIGGTTATVGTALSREAFDASVERQRTRYGDHGVWGIGSEPDHDLEFVGAWTRRVGLDTDGDPRPDPDSTDGLRAVADAVAVAYEIPDREAAEKRQYQLWLWAAGRLVADADGGALAATPGLRRVEVGVELDGSGAEMGPYAPGSDRSDGPIAVGPATPGVDGPAASVPIDAGEIRVVPERTGFDQNAYAAQWRGDHDGSQSVNATCEAAWDGDPSFGLTVRLTADRRRL